MATEDRREVVHVKKYPNRRYYDTARSRHVTLQEVFDLIVAGHDVSIRDSRTGDDLTNLVLIQILVQKEQLKLNLLPNSILHSMIRSDHEVIRASIERFLGPPLGAPVLPQQQFDTLQRDVAKGRSVSPHDLAGELPEAVPARTGPDSPVGSGRTQPTVDVGAPLTEEAADYDELRRRVDALQRRIRELEAGRSPDRP